MSYSPERGIDGTNDQDVIAIVQDVLAEAVFVRIPIGTGGITVSVCHGDPNGQLTEVQGSVALRDDGGAGTSFYVKETGSDNQGWVGK